jgi:alpha-mannosidase
MKIISLVVFVLALIGTWYISHRQQVVPESVHVGIQNDLKRIIAEYVQKNLPGSKNLIFKKFFTETLQNNKVKATFLYSFDDTNENIGASNLEIEGYAVLNKVGESAQSTEWSMDELHILNNSVEFKDPMKITPKVDPDEATPAPAVPATPEGE